MKLKSSLAIASVALLVFAGCASDPASKAAKAGVHTVRLDRNIDCPASMRYGPSDTSEEFDNSLSSDMVNEVGQHGLRRMTKVMAHNNINVSTIVETRIEKQLREHSGFTFADHDADGVFTVKIVEYGFDNPHLSLTRQYPFVIINIELHDKNGQVLWARKSGYIEPGEGDPGTDWDGYESHPDELVDAWDFQIDRVINKLIPNKGK
jgi:hypothetical protein